MAVAHSFAVATPRGTYAARGNSIMGSAIDASLSVLAAARRPIISFAMGSPAADAIPTRKIARRLSEVLGERDASTALDYSPTEGLPELRTTLLARLARQGLGIDPACLLVTAGGMQGLDLVNKLFVEPDDLVIAESPSYANGLATAHNYGARIAQIRLDDEGLDLDEAERVVRDVGKAPKVIYTIPTFQNPSGASYSVERRRRLLELARDWGAIVIEDDPYSELRYDGDPLPSLLELDGSNGTVIQVRTFSKIIAPGLRLGWVIAPVDTVRRMVAAKQSMDTCANSLAQRAVARLLSMGDVDAHVRILRELYPRRRDAMIAALQREAGHLDGANWTRPSGGMFIWMNLPPNLDGDAVLAAGLERGVAVVPGSAFDSTQCRNAIRLCFSAVDEAAISAGIPRLGETLQAVAAAGRLHRQPTARIEDG